MTDEQAIADVIVDAVKFATAQLEARLAALEQRQADIPLVNLIDVHEDSKALKALCQELERELLQLRAERAERDRADQDALRRDVAELKVGRFGR